MAKSRDILLNDDNELLISKGDFVTGDSDEQHVSLIIRSSPGDWKQHPLVGVGIIKEINSPETAQTKENLSKRIKGQLEFDDYENATIDLTDLKNIKVNCDRI
jgi:hypothetical protein